MPKIRNFYGVKFLRHFNFGGFFNKFWISWHFNFAVQPKYYILRHFNFAVLRKNYDSQHFNFVAALKIQFFMCVSFQHFRNFGKSMEPKWKLKDIFIFFLNTMIRKSIKTSKKILFGLKISTSHHLSLQLDLQMPRLYDLPPACQIALYYDFVMAAIK